MPPLGRFVACWGNGQHGRLGHMCGESSELFPRIVAALAGQRAAQVACGGAHTAAVMEDGSLWTWGINSRGQLGHSNDLKHCGEPTEVILPDRIASVQAGEAHTLAVSASGEIWAAGCNSDGQLGLGDEYGARNAEFRLVRGLRGRAVRQVAAGQEHSLALGAGGEVWAWGRGAYGQLGLGPSLTRWVVTPRRVEALEGVRVAAVAAGAFHSAAVDADGNAYVWGRGDSYQLGTGLKNHECLPQQLRTLQHVKQLALGCDYSLAVGSHGRVASWGTDDSGCLGQGLKWPRPATPAPARVAARLAAAAAGWRHAAGADEDGRLFAWGWGGAVGAGGLAAPSADLGAGQLGLGDDRDRFEPSQVLRLRVGPAGFRDLRQSVGAGGGLWRARGVSCGRNHTAAVVEVALEEHEIPRE
ncbi:MAG: regulator of chromosome condensation 1/beta-lactamase-inhibitor protein II [Monoraphidium minutum]|nr:MAG: regulator of chromosome condensation 1/beta-lactamase-inhibitor protein II [Monoraphidium minutum]